MATKKALYRPRRMPGPYHSMHLHMPMDLYEQLGRRAFKLGISRASLIRNYVSSCLQDAERTDEIAAKQAKIYG